MAGTFFGFYTALRGMMAQRHGVYTTSHNVANANTEGFSRQRVVLEATPAYPVPALNEPGGTGWQIGTGVNVQETTRVRDRFLDGQIRRESGILGQWDEVQDVLGNVEVVFNEPNDHGLNALFAKFWGAWQELAMYGESSPVRTNVVEFGKSLAEALNHSARQLVAIQADIDTAIAINAQEINSMAKQIAALNRQIKNITLAGDAPNDLLDRRDLLLDRLSEFVDCQVAEHSVLVNGQMVSDGQVRVLVDGRALVDIDAAGDSFGNEVAVGETGEEPWQLYWAGDPAPRTEIAPGQGRIAGLQQARASVQEYRDRLDVLARGLAENINALHRGGYDLHGQPVDSDGLADTDACENYFVALGDPPGLGDISQAGITAANIGVNLNLVNDVSRLAAAATGSGQGEAGNALKIAQLKDQLLEVGGGTMTPATSGVTLDDYYRNMIARLGVEAAEAERMTENQTVLVDQLTWRKQSVAGVSLDEEMGLMLQYQRGYEASARMITTLNEMLETIIHRLG
ncbi:MAG TPA: flagellar hook-associated protein FlgK [Firmicutes bacterium]|jgi:flagellar hook-associated protein 1 FlgK|nr:flagellar hook-associated protein FlgK [Bacillota bacterium]